MIGLKAWHHSFKGSAVMLNVGMVYPHSADGPLVWQVPRSVFVLSHEVSSLFWLLVGKSSVVRSAAFGVRHFRLVCRAPCVRH